MHSVHAARRSARYVSQMHVALASHRQREDGHTFPNTSGRCVAPATLVQGLRGDHPSALPSARHSLARCSSNRAEMTCSRSSCAGDEMHACQNGKEGQRSTECGLCSRLRTHHFRTSSLAPRTLASLVTTRSPPCVLHRNENMHEPMLLLPFMYGRGADRGAPLRDHPVSGPD
jgi:hypothetical protein